MKNLIVEKKRKRIKQAPKWVALEQAEEIEIKQNN